MTGSIRIVRGNPDEIELAALIAVLLEAPPPCRGRLPDEALSADRSRRASWHYAEPGYESPRSWTSP